MKSNTHAAPPGLPPSPPLVTEDFSLLKKRPDRLWSPHSRLLTGYRCSFPWVKQLGRDVNRSPSSGAEVNNAWSPTCPPVCLHGVARENFAWHTVQPTGGLADPNSGLSHYRSLWDFWSILQKYLPLFFSFGNDSCHPFQTKFKIQNDVVPRRKRFKMSEMIFLQEA